MDLEGGFWGVIDDAGNKYVPIEPLDEHLLKDGQRISGEIELVTVFSSTMWGKHVRFHRIQPE